VRIMRMNAGDSVASLALVDKNADIEDDTPEDVIPAEILGEAKED
jgi:hypothetical protein